MSSSTVLGGEVSDRAGWPAGLVVERDRGGQGKEPVGDPGAQGVEGPGAVAFAGEDVFAGPEDALDPLSDRREMRVLSGLVLASWAQNPRAEIGDAVLERAAGVALVADHGDGP